MTPGFAPRVEAFEAVERRDPHWSAVHLAAACLWCCSLALAKAPEGATFALLAAVAVIRLPSTWRLYPALLRAWPFRALLLLAAWQAIALAWTSNPTPEYANAFPRALLLPPMLWPLMHRWRALLVGFGAGVCAHSAQLLVRSWNGAGFDQYNDSKPLISHLASAGTIFAAGSLLLWAIFVFARGVGALLLSAAGLALCVGGLAVLSVRTSIAAFVVGCVVSAVYAVRRGGDPRRTWLLVGVGSLSAIILLGVAATQSSRFVVWWRQMERASERDSHAPATTQAPAHAPADDPTHAPAHAPTSAAELKLEQALNKQPRDSTVVFVASSGRMPLWRAALEIWREHPIAGSGTQSWKTECQPRITGNPAAYGVPASEVATVARLPGAHCAYLQELAERGAVGLALFLFLLIGVGHALWRAAAGWESAAAVGIFAAWCASALVQSQTVQGLSMLLLALLLTRACVPAVRITCVPPAMRRSLRAPAIG